MNKKGRTLKSGLCISVLAKILRCFFRCIVFNFFTGSSTALRAAGLTSVESGITCMSMETAAAGGGVLLSEIIVPVAVACLAIYVVYTCVSYWSSLPPKERGYGKITVDSLPRDSPHRQTISR